jgi:hypothetical protein
MKLTEKGSMAAMPDRPENHRPGTYPGGFAEADARPGTGPARNLLFLREEELRLAQDLLYFGYRDFTAGADRILLAPEPPAQLTAAERDGGASLASSFTSMPGGSCGT